MIEKRRGIWYIYGILIFITLWYISAILVNLPIIPNPWVVMMNLLNIFIPKILIHGVYSLWRIMAGVFGLLLSIFFEKY
jgi:NitT/TauT family transport system permease protein